MSGELKELETAAKKFVNERRKEVGLRATGKLSKGYRMDSMLCPIAKALHCVGVRYVVRDKDEIGLQNANERTLWWKDSQTYAFMRAFDDGKYPHLEIPPTPVKIKYPGDRKSTIIS